MLIRTFRDSDAWQASHELTLDVYRASACFPKSEMFGLTSQVRRSAASVGANLAEGFGRHSKRELRRSCLIANGSLQETMNHIHVARDLGFLETEEAGRLLTGQLGSASFLAGSNAVSIVRRL